MVQKQVQGMQVVNMLSSAIQYKCCLIYNSGDRARNKRNGEIGIETRGRDSRADFSFFRVVWFMPHEERTIEALLV